MLVAASAMLEDGVSEALRPGLEMIRRNVELEARLIDDLLDLTRLARGTLRLEHRPVDMHDVIARAVEICRGAAAEAGLAVRTELEAGDPIVLGDATRLQQIVWNLLQNAVKFTPEGGTIAVRSRADGPGRLVVEVADTGIGIDPEVLPRIFEAFEQGDVAPLRRASGLGLGLAIGRSLAEAHGGRLSARSAGPGAGAAFALELATMPDPAAATADLPTCTGLPAGADPDATRPAPASVASRPAKLPPCGSCWSRTTATPCATSA